MSDDDDFGSELMFFEDEKSQLSVNKRIIMSGDNLEWCFIFECFE